MDIELYVVFKKCVMEIKEMVMWGRENLIGGINEREW